MLDSSPHSRLDEIGRTLRHAQATRRTETDSWLNGYQEDVAYLLEQLETLRTAAEAMLSAERNPRDLQYELRAALDASSPAKESDA